MAETTNISKLIINYLTEQQYTTAQASGLINANELYIESAQRLLGVAHPSTHSADIIVDGTTNKAYTATEKTKLAGIATGAEVNVQSDWNVTDDTSDAYIKNKPTISDGLLPKIVVTVDTDSAITCTDGTTTLTGTSTGSYIFEIPNYGTWTVSATLNGETSSTESIVIDAVKIYSITLGYRHIYGFTINEAESNSMASVTYTDESTSYTKGSSSWDTSPLFANIKPCLFKDGAVVGYLQRDDYTKFENGTVADITSGSAGDIMVEIPKMAYYMEKTGNIITCKVCMGNDAKTVDSRYTYLPFSRDTEGDRDKIYIGAYLGYTLSTKLRSLSGKAPSATQTIGTFRTQAYANGTGYQQLPFYQLTLLQILYIMKYGSLDSQTALGRGYVDGNTNAINTGGANSKGFCYGEATGKLQMKMFGIEDFYGNLYQWIDGLYCNASWAILTTYKSFNNTGSGYLFNNSSGLSANTGGYMNQSQGTTQAGFNLKAGSGSSSTYYADYASLYAGSLPTFGGDWSNASYAGAFLLYVSYSASSASAGIGARLCYI